MSFYSKHKSLNKQIRNAKRCVSSGQRAIHNRTSRLTQKCYRQITTPASLLLAVGIGFIVGELTKSRCGSADKSRVTQSDPLKIALNLITSMRTLYAALPIAWLMKTRYQTDITGQND
jgi:hypothetical protein